jgi:hypothetical protein
VATASLQVFLLCCFVAFLLFENIAEINHLQRDNQQRKSGELKSNSERTVSY